MILNYTSAKETATSGASMDAWLAKLGEGKKSLQQLQTEMLDDTTKAIDKMKEKAAEKSKEAAQEEAQKAAGGTSTPEAAASGTTAVKDDIKAPSEITAADLESPIDIKL